MSTETPGNPFGDVTKIMEQFKMPGIDMPALIEARRKDIDALVEANRTAFESMKALGARQTEMFTEAMQGIQDSVKNAAAGGTASADAGQQAERVRKACEKALADMKELAEMTVASQADTMAHITRRANEHLAEIKKLMQAG